VTNITIAVNGTRCVEKVAGRDWHNGSSFGLSQVFFALSQPDGVGGSSCVAGATKKEPIDALPTPSNEEHLPGNMPPTPRISRKRPTISAGYGMEKAMIEASAPAAGPG
jgi:hypothetical protein